MLSKGYNWQNLIVFCCKKSIMMKIGDTYNSLLVWQLAWNIFVKQIHTHYEIVDGTSFYNWKHDFFIKTYVFKSADNFSIWLKSRDYITN
jgi:hypothetical protein